MKTKPTLRNPTTRRYRLTGYASLNIPDIRPRGRDWQQDGWLQIEPAQLAPDHPTDETTYGRLVNRLGNSKLCTARWGFRRIRHPAAEHPETVRAANEGAVVECAGAQRRRIAVDGLQTSLLPVNRHDFHWTLRHPNQWLR